MQHTQTTTKSDLTSIYARTRTKMQNNTVNAESRASEIKINRTHLHEGFGRRWKKAESETQRKPQHVS